MKQHAGTAGLRPTVWSVNELNLSLGLVWCFFFQAPVKALLPEIESSDAGKICVVIDLDETLVHSSFKVCWPMSSIF